MEGLMNKIDVDRIVQNTHKLVEIADTAGNTRQVAALYGQLLEEIGLTVERHELIENNPTLVTRLKGGKPGKTLIFNGHLDVIPLRHAPPEIRDGKIYGRGTCDMKGPLACILEVLRVLQVFRHELSGDVVLIANSMHESPDGRGEDLTALVNQVPIQADAAVVMEGTTFDCTIAQLGSATFNIKIERNGEPSHQLHTPEGTPHPATVTAAVIEALDRANRELEKEWIEDIGYASYFIGSVHTGEFYNQMPKVATVEGVRRYSPQHSFVEVEQELRDLLADMADRHGVSIQLDMKKVRDGYRIDKDAEIVRALVQSVQKIRDIKLPLTGKKIVTDAGILAKDLGVPTVCHGPDQRTAHGEVEYVEIHELDLTARVYLQLIADYIGIHKGVSV